MMKELSTRNKKDESFEHVWWVGYNGRHQMSRSGGLCHALLRWRSSQLGRRTQISGACSERVLVVELWLPAELCRDSMLGSHCELLEIKVSVVASLALVLRELSKLEHRGRNNWWGW